MKIAMIGQKGIPSRAGGVEIHVEEIASRLAGSGCSVYVFCRKGYSGINTGKVYKNINIRFVPYIGTKHLDAITHTFSSTIAALLMGCDIFHYHALGPATLSFIPKIFGKKVVCTVHGLDWQRRKWGAFASRYLKFGEYATAKFSNAVINVSRNLVDYYKKKYNKDTVYIPNGVEKGEFRQPDIISKNYGLVKDEYILFLARLVPEKGAHYLIDAFNRLNCCKKLAISGCSSHSDKYEAELHKMASDNSNIVFTGFVAGDELEELYSNAYLYILPSDIEGLPISLLEAMSFDNCCLTSDIPENADVVKDMGYTFKKSDVADLSEKLEMLINQEEKVYAVKKNVCRNILEEYNWDDAAEKTLAVYKKLMMDR